MAEQILNLLPSSEQRFGRYLLLGHLATGGMAKLYLARIEGPENFEKLVVIKRIHEHLSEDPEFLKMFVDEARLASWISHPNVVQVMEFGVVGNSHYIAMEYVDGESLVALIRRMKPPLRICARIAAQAAAGLHAAHELRSMDGELLSVVHRDVSPQNILISYEGDIKVVDFGVARVRGSLHSTTTGTLKGKLGYMAPEQLLQHPVDRRTDIFALGIILYEITTRHRLYKADSEAAIVSKVLNSPIVPPSHLVSDYPAKLEHIVLKALQRDPAARFQTAEKMQEALETYIMESGPPLMPSSLGQIMRHHFADRIEHKRNLLRQSAYSSTAILENNIVSNPSLTMGGATVSKADHLLSQQHLPKNRHWLWAAGGGVTLIFIGAISYLLINREAASIPNNSPKSTPTAQKQNPKRSPAKAIVISIKAMPTNAFISLDGRPVSNPYEIHKAISPGSLQAEISAPGYQTQRFDISLEEGGRWVIALAKISEAPQATQKNKVIDNKGQSSHRRWPRRSKPAKSDDELFGDPFNEK